MKVQTLYAVAGVIWGLVLGPDAGLYAARIMGSVDALYQYADGAWADWIIIPFGTTIGLAVLFACYQLGAAAGHRYDDATERQLRHSKSVPWALLVLGIGIGAVTALTIDDRQRAVARYVQAQKDAAARLLEFAETVHRIPLYSIDWPGGGEAGRIDLSFRGKREGNYRFDWKIYAQDGKEPLLANSYIVGLGKTHERTNVPLSAAELANAYLVALNRVEPVMVVDERFRLVLELRPILGGKDWDALPEQEAERLDSGDSILLDRVTTTFPVKFEYRGGRVAW